MNMADLVQLEFEYYRSRLADMPRDIRALAVAELMNHAWKHLARRRGSDNEARRVIMRCALEAFAAIWSEPDPVLELLRYAGPVAASSKPLRIPFRRPKPLEGFNHDN